MSKGTVLSLFESKGGMRIDEARLSAPLAAKLEQLDLMLRVFDHILNEVRLLDERRRRYRRIFLGTIIPAVLGLVIVVFGFIDKYLDMSQWAVSLLATIGLFIAGYYISRYERSVRSVYLRKSKQVDGFTVDLEARLDTVYDQVLGELYPTRRPASFGKRPMSAEQRFKNR